MCENSVQGEAIIEGHQDVIYLLILKKWVCTENFCLPGTSHMGVILKGQKWLSLKRTFIFRSRRKGLDTNQTEVGGRIWKWSGELARSLLLLLCVASPAIRSLPGQTLAACLSFLSSRGVPESMGVEGGSPSLTISNPVTSTHSCYLVLYIQVLPSPRDAQLVK